MPTGYQEKVLHREGGPALEQAAEGSGHSTEPDRVQKVFGQHSRTRGQILGWSFGELGVELDDPCGSFPTQAIL